MKCCISALMLWLGLWLGGAQAAGAIPPAGVDVKRALIDDLQRDGYLTPQAAEAARARYLGAAAGMTPPAAPAAAASAADVEPSAWTR